MGVPWSGHVTSAALSHSPPLAWQLHHLQQLVWRKKKYPSQVRYPLSSSTSQCLAGGSHGRGAARWSQNPACLVLGPSRVPPPANTTLRIIRAGAITCSYLSQHNAEKETQLRFSLPCKWSRCKHKEHADHRHTHTHTNGLPGTAITLPASKQVDKGISTETHVVLRFEAQHSTASNPSPSLVQTLLGGAAAGRWVAFHHVLTCRSLAARRGPVRGLADALAVFQVDMWFLFTSILTMDATNFVYAVPSLA